jgi:nucleoside phosphorylase
MSAPAIDAPGRAGAERASAGAAGARGAGAEHAGAERAGAEHAGAEHFGVAAGTRGVTAIVSPLTAELAGVARLTRGRRVLRVRGEGGSWRVIRGRLGGEEVALAATGDGGPAAAAGLAALLAALRPRRLLVLGVAGGLSPGLAAGSLVAARRVLADDGGAAPARDPDAAWLAQALRRGAMAGLAVSTGAILGGPDAKQAALRRVLRAEAAIQAALPAVAADLESAAYARVAAAWPLPYLVVRAVLDPADEQLPLDFEACRDASGRVSNVRVLLRALARPRRLADLWRLRSRLAGGAARLGAFAADLLASAQTPDPAALAAPADHRPAATRPSGAAVATAPPTLPASPAPPAAGQAGKPHADGDPGIAAGGGFQLSVAVTRRPG